MTSLKKIFTFFAAVVFSFPLVLTVAANAQTPTTTNLTSPQTDFGRDVKDGIESTKNDSIAQKQQKDDKDNEIDEAKEEAEAVEVKEAEEETEVPDGVEAKDVDSEGTKKDQTNDSSGTSKEGNNNSGSNEGSQDSTKPGD